MGSKFEVRTWINEESFGWHSAEYWRGESFFAAIYHLWKAKRTGTGCATLNWR